MIEPADFGLSGVRTFAHVGDPTPSPDHSVFWNHWYAAVTSEQPAIRRRSTEDPSDPTATHEFDSAGGVRIGGRLVLPPKGTRVRAGLVVVHGAAPRECAVEDARWKRVAAQGVMVFAIRLRGFPGSQRETGDLRTPDAAGAGWIGRGLDAEIHEEWIVPHAVADVFQACRVLRNWILGRRGEGVDAEPEPTDHPLVFLFGESLGGGLAVMAAAQLAGRIPRAHFIDRLAIGLPSLGDWPWRLRHPAGGTGADVEKVLTRHAARRAELVNRLRLCDAVVHAAKVRRPTLAKLAARDDVVPAPTAAAIFNAIDADPARKWRFLVPYGHIDGGITNARRHALFERCMADFFDPAARPIDLMEAWEPMLHAGDRTPGGETASITLEPDDNTPPPALFEASPDADTACLIRAYETVGRTLDALPYTDDFERLCQLAGADDRGGALRTLQRLRKAGRLPRLGRAPEHPPKIDAEHEAVLEALVVEHAGSLGQRDRLPHSPEFDRVLEAFNARTGSSLGPHDLWRLIARLAK
jgi:cephalosporin-C deacetylase-like acetyl esterase